jgi:hypothetical protein
MTPGQPPIKKKWEPKTSDCFLVTGGQLKRLRDEGDPIKRKEIVSDTWSQKYTANTRTTEAPEAKIAPGEIVYSSTHWKIFRQDSGMGEHDYAVFLNDVFFCRTEHSQTAHEIIRAIRRSNL